MNEPFVAVDVFGDAKLGTIVPDHGGYIRTILGWQAIRGRDLESAYSLSSGRLFFPFDPRPDEIAVHDIFIGLANCCRWAGQVPHFYSTATHSKNLSKIVPEKYRKWALFHDSSDAVIPDLITPLEKTGLFTVHTEMERNITGVVAESLGLSGREVPKTVQYYDQLIKLAEAMVILGEQAWIKFNILLEHEDENKRLDPKMLRDAEKLIDYVEFESPTQSYLSFVARYNELFQDSND